MELDEFKQRWQKVSDQDAPPQNERRLFLRRRDQGPVAALKRNFRRQIIVLVIVFFLFLHQLRDRELYHNVFFLWYTSCALLLCLFFFINMRLVKRFENPDGTLTAHISSKIALLEQRLRWRRVFTRIAIAVLIVLLETLPFFSTESMLQKWHSVSPFIRVAAYAGLLLFHHYIGRLAAYRRYGRHLERLKKILTDAE